GQDRRHVLLVTQVEGVAHRQASLLHRGGGERGEADHIARRVDVRYGGLEVLVHGDLPPRAHGYADGTQGERFGGAVGARGDQDRLGRQRVAGLKAQVVTTVRRAPYLLDCVGKAEGDAEVGHPVPEGTGDLLVEEGKWPIPGVHDGDRNAQRGEGAGVL